MTIGAALQYTNRETELLLSVILQKPKEFLYLHPQKKLTNPQYAKLEKMIVRRQKGEPIAYILGYKYFYGLQFSVNPSVLIPRPETELLVDEALKIILSEKIKSVADVGTGSGAIILSLAKVLGNKHISFWGSDVSEKALSVAKKNAKQLGLQSKVRFKQSNLLTNIKTTPELLLANLPYGWEEWKNNSSSETRGLAFEPKVALFTAKHGLALIEKLLKQVSKRVQQPKYMLLEFDPRQKKELEGLIKKYFPKSNVGFYKDYAGHFRLVTIAIKKAE
jgi:release factor glutamine methyltransferase